MSTPSHCTGVLAEALIVDWQCANPSFSTAIWELQIIKSMQFTVDLWLMKRILFYITKNERENRHKNGTVKPSTDTPLLPSFIFAWLGMLQHSTTKSCLRQIQKSLLGSRLPAIPAVLGSKRYAFSRVAVLQLTRPKLIHPQCSGGKWVTVHLINQSCCLWESDQSVRNV